MDQGYTRLREFLENSEVVIVLCINGKELTRDEAILLEKYVERNNHNLAMKGKLLVRDMLSMMDKDLNVYPLVNVA